jgi:hypothetical protein
MQGNSIGELVDGVALDVDVAAAETTSRCLQGKFCLLWVMLLLPLIVKTRG